MSVIELLYPGWKQLKIHESSPCERGASARLKKECRDYIPSQYWPEKKLGECYNGFFNIDLEEQTFNDGVFDLVITQDVYEHLYNPDKATREIYRTLKDGGAHICTIPLVNKNKPTERWSDLVNGKAVFLKEPEYHGNPIDRTGSPVSFHYGYDLGLLVQQWSGFNCMIFYIDDLSRGIRAEFNEVLVMKKERHLQCL